MIFSFAKLLVDAWFSPFMKLWHDFPFENLLVNAFLFLFHLPICWWMRDFLFAQLLVNAWFFVCTIVGECMIFSHVKLWYRTWFFFIRKILAHMHDFFITKNCCWKHDFFFICKIVGQCMILFYFSLWNCDIAQPVDNTKGSFNVLE